jgi:hypothetical protein
MKNIPIFETFVNEATAVDKALEVARKFLNDVEAEFKVEIEESEMMKMTPKGFEIRAVILHPITDKMYDWVKVYTAEHKDDAKGVPLQFKISEGIKGRSTLWPADDKKHFLIVR